ncbi:MAG TPA: response regulator transcription factor [Kofleriaceae bacterium]|nr:response regulator transcription factor [Kofleriaceae bacterium]
MIRVYLVDDHPIVRHGIAQLLSAQADLEVCGQAADARSALAELAAAAPDVVTVDVSLGATSGIDLIGDIKQHHARIAVLVVSMHDEQLYAERALRAGASGYVMKHEATDAIVRAIRTVAAGGIFVSEAVSARLLRLWVASGAPGEGSPLDALSNRELHVLELIGRGLGTREIAEMLHISVKTVESYRARRKEKMNLRSGIELTRFAMHWAADDRKRETGDGQ